MPTPRPDACEHARRVPVSRDLRPREAAALVNAGWSHFDAMAGLAKPLWRCLDCPSVVPCP